MSGSEATGPRDRGPVAVVLAAGEGSRFAGPTHKLLARLGDRPVVAWSVGAAVAAGLDVIVVTGAVDLAAALPPGVRVVANPDWRRGQSASLRVGCAAAGAAGHDAVVVGLGDMPGIRPEAWRAVAASTATVAVATYGGRRSHPVRFHRSVWADIPGEGDNPGRTVMRSHESEVQEIPCHGEIADIDRVEDLNQWS